MPVVIDADALKMLDMDLIKKYGKSNGFNTT